MHVATLVLLLLLVIAVAGPLSRLVRLPLPLLLIAAGAALAVAGVHVRFEPDLFLLLFIPPLLFSDAFLMPLREFRQVQGVVIAMAVGLVLFSTLGGGWLLHAIVPELPLVVGFTLAAILSPTDAVSVGSMIDETQVPSRFMRILQGEALLNDASGLVCFKFAAAAAMTGSFSLASASANFALVALGGLAVGVVLTMGFNLVNSQLQRIGFDDPATQCTLVVLLPFAAYLGAEHLGVSGILAAVSAGLYANQSRIFGRAQTLTRLRATSVWAMVTFVFNGMVFLLLGLQLPEITATGIALARAVHVPLWRLGLLATMLTVGLLVLRLLWIWLALGVRWGVARLRGRTAIVPTFTGTLGLALAGVRGAVTLAGVLSLPEAGAEGAGFPHRDLLVTLAAGVIVVSLLGAALLLPLVTRRLRERPDVARRPHDDEVEAARVAMAHAALDSVQADHAPEPDPDAQARAEVRGGLVAEFQRRLRLLGDSGEEDTTRGEHDGRGWRRDALIRQRLESSMRLRALRAERTRLGELRQRRQISDTTERELLRDIDYEETVLANQAQALPRQVDEASAG